MSDKMKIIICTHKNCDMPTDDIFIPIQVGKAISTIDLGLRGDDTGDNISTKNVSFCELTALYWAWKNIKNLYPGLEYIGFCHYRRYLALDKLNLRNEIYLNDVPILKNTEKMANHILKNSAIILQKKIIHPYSLYFNHSLFHHSDDYRTLKEIMHNIHPEYDNSFLYIFEKNNKCSYYNIFISEYSMFKNYCEWLFPILFEAEKKIRIDNYNDFQKRIFGFFAERLLNVYVYHNKIKTKYKPIYCIVNKKQRSYLIDILCNIKNSYIFYMQRLLLPNFSD
ncbi:exopolysaccharide biosynthesis protein [Spirochaetia bacterium]|nr:exopolysaccharide biosynthesis protein [Spirochaetia bacterium]